jgi:Hint domain
VNDVPYQVGVYGPGNVLSSLGLKYSWLADAWSNDGYTSQTIEQTQTSGPTIGSIPVDLDVAYASDFGQWSGVACFTEGTCISTSRGDMPVERLCEGDRVQVQPGGTQPIMWIGHRHVDCTKHPKPTQVWPVRISAGAFGPARPHRDLFLSPDHAIYIMEVLIPAKHLINGTTIVQEPMDEVTYYHIELPHHDVLLANGMPAESYLDVGACSNFANGGALARLFPDFSPPSIDLATLWEARGCAPLIVCGPELEAVRRWVNALSAASIRTRAVA